MSRRTVVVKADLLQEAINKAEKNGPKANQSELWKETARIYNENRGVELISHSVVYLRFNQFGLTCKTPKGKKGRASLSEEQKERMQEARRNAPRKSKSEQLKSIPNYDKNVETMLKIAPSSAEGLIKRLLNGSRVAAEKLHCLQCVGFERAAVRECSSYSCPLFLFRPYQRVEDDTEEMEDMIEDTEEMEDMIEDTEEMEVLEIDENGFEMEYKD